MLSGETLWAQYSYTLFVMMTSDCQEHVVSCEVGIVNEARAT
jgi:hypothetical protein